MTHSSNVKADVCCLLQWVLIGAMTVTTGVILINWTRDGDPEAEPSWANVMVTECQGKPGEPGGAALSGARESVQPWNSREDAWLIWGGNEPIRWENDPGADWWDSDPTMKSQANRMGTGDWLDVKPEAATTDGMRSSDFGERQRMRCVTRSNVCVSAAQGCQTLHNAKQYISA